MTCSARALGTLSAMFLGAALAACSTAATVTDGGVDAPRNDANDVFVATDVAPATDSIDVTGPTACTRTSECPRTQYCEGGGGCGTPGTCTERPSQCSPVADPYCGCDGLTYPNACVAAQAGVRVAGVGTCSSVDAGSDVSMDVPRDVRDVSTDAVVDAPADVIITPGSCLSNANCLRTQYCEGLTGCGTPGTCLVRPTTCSTLVNPVCGCNNVTYINRCTANSVGVQMALRGACVDASVDRCATVRCALGSLCCPSTGLCYPSGCLSCCR